MLGRGILITGNMVSAFEDHRRWRLEWNELGGGAARAVQSFAGCDKDLAFSLSTVGRC